MKKPLRCSKPIPQSLRTTPTTVKSQIVQDSHPASSQPEAIAADGDQKVLCIHCKRTATNGLKCKGICVADNDY
ncbi:MAG: hypothetical protein MH252_20635 [Thermosynechococcaceae cyanobacterium MS004]|nr:hypothetical protein [Thermosynechococcaceae cyanobacterium MS004]